MAFARNDRLFTDGSDQAQLARETRYVLAGTEDVAKAFRAIVLPSAWATTPWTGLDDAEQPDRWDDRLPILVLPEEPDKLHERLGRWLKDHLQRRRNIVRYLLPRAGSTNAYYDRDLLVLARAILKAQEWRTQSPEYAKLQTKYQTELRAIIKQRFDRFAVLRTWSFTDATHCKFHVENLSAQGGKIPEAIEDCLKSDIFVPEDFESLILVAAGNNESVGKILRELQEPRPNEEDCIPWLGETLMKESILRLCARGQIAINLRGMEYVQAAPGEDEESAWRRMRGRLGTGKHLDETYLLLPQAVPQAHGVSATQPSGGAPPPPGGLFPPSPPGGVKPPVELAPAPPNGRGAIFGDSTPSMVVQLSAPATSALNLIGKVEGWGIGPATAVREVNLKVTAATGAQLQKVLRALPDGLTYELTLKKDEG
jgi:hypothetical protein